MSIQARGCGVRKDHPDALAIVVHGFLQYAEKDNRPQCPPLALRFEPHNNSWIVGNPSLTRSPSSKLGLDADSVIHRGLNSLFAAKIAICGLH